MPDEVKPDLTQDQPQEAQLAAENMASGQEKTQVVDFDADYEASKQFSVSDIDRSGEGAQAAEAATKSQFKVPETEETKTETQSTGNPDDYLGMAKEIEEDVDSTNEDPTQVSDDLVKKALEKGEPGH